MLAHFGRALFVLGITLLQYIVQAGAQTASFSDSRNTYSATVARKEFAKFQSRFYLGKFNFYQLNHLEVDLTEIYSKTETYAKQKTRYAVKTGWKFGDSLWRPPRLAGVRYLEFDFLLGGKNEFYFYFFIFCSYIEYIYGEKDYLLSKVSGKDNKNMLWSQIEIIGAEAAAVKGSLSCLEYIVEAAGGCEKVEGV